MRWMKEKRQRKDKKGKPEKRLKKDKLQEG